MSTIKEIQKILNGTEILSIKYSGCIGVRGNKIIRNGEIIKTIKTKKEWIELEDEAFYNEFGFFPTHENIEKMRDLI